MGINTRNITQVGTVFFHIYLVRGFQNGIILQLITVLSIIQKTVQRKNFKLLRTQQSNAFYY